MATYHPLIVNIESLSLCRLRRFWRICSPQNVAPNNGRQEVRRKLHHKPADAAVIDRLRSVARLKAGVSQKLCCVLTIMAAMFTRCKKIRFLFVVWFTAQLSRE
jgi:hypothetical protein